MFLFEYTLYKKQDLMNSFPKSLLRFLLSQCMTFYMSNYIALKSFYYFLSSIGPLFSTRASLYNLITFFGFSPCLLARVCVLAETREKVRISKTIVIYARTIQNKETRLNRWVHK